MNVHRRTKMKDFGKESVRGGQGKMEFVENWFFFIGRRRMCNVLVDIFVKVFIGNPQCNNFDRTVKEFIYLYFIFNLFFSNNLARKIELAIH